jgi:hypothetical protein
VARKKRKDNTRTEALCKQNAAVGSRQVKGTKEESLSRASSVPSGTEDKEGKKEEGQINQQEKEEVDS